MNVIQVTTRHPRRDVRIFVKECATIAASGIGRVTLLVADGHGDEVVDGVAVHDVGMPPGGRVARALRTGWRVVRAVRRARGDVVHFHDPETIPFALLLRLLGHRVIYDVHEDVPRQILDKEWIPRPLRRPVAAGMAALEQVAGRVFSAIVAATPRIGERFPRARTVVVQNFPLERELAPPARVSYAQRPPMFAFVGVLTSQRGAFEMVRALEHLPARDGVTIEIAGKFAPDTLAAELAALPRGGRVRSHGWLARPDVSALLGRARAGLLLLHPLANHLHAQPNKMFEYMASGLPVIASDFPLWRRIIGEAGCGLLVDPLDPRAIAEAMRWMLAHPDEAAAMGERGREAVVRRYNWEAEAQHLVDLYHRLGASTVAAAVA